MTPGNTVIRNEAVPDPSDYRALRGDVVLFLEEQGLSSTDFKSSPAPALALLEIALTDLGMRLDAFLQRTCSVRITERTDGMLACYDPSAGGYRPHIDNADGDGRVDGRVLTIVFYLNEGWDASKGGELAIFEPVSNVDGGVDGAWRCVLPEMDTIVFFRADRTLHEVRPATARRLALTQWFCGSPLGRV